MSLLPHTHPSTTLLPRRAVDPIASITMGEVRAQDGGVWLDDRAASDVAELIAAAAEAAEAEEEAAVDLGHLDDAICDVRAAIDELSSAARSMRHTSAIAS